MRLSAFSRAQWAVGLALSFAIASMFLYPGGTGLDASTAGYSLWQNFLSDLGMTVAHNGQTNGVGGLCYVLAAVSRAAPHGGARV